MFTPHTLASARFVHLNGRRYVSLHDAVTLLGGSPYAPDVLLGFRSLPSGYTSTEDLPNENLSFEPAPVVSTAGLLLFLLNSPQDVLSSFAMELAAAELEKLFQVSPSAVPGTGTRWGEQPFRNLIRGTGLSMAEVVRTMNMHRQGEEKPLTQASLTSIAMGRQMPNPQVLRCLAMVLVTKPEKLFNPDVLGAYERKHGPLPGSPVRTTVVPPSASPTPSAPPFQLRDFSALDSDTSEPSPEDLQFDPSEEPDYSSEEYWSAQDALLEQAKAEFQGASSANPFEAGFAAVMGKVEPSEDPSSD